MYGQLFTAGVLVAVAYLKGRIDATLGDEIPGAPSDGIAAAHAETAATRAPAPVLDAHAAVDELRPGWRAEATVPADALTVPEFPAPVQTEAAAPDDDVRVVEPGRLEPIFPGRVRLRDASPTERPAADAPPGPAAEGDFFVSGLASAPGDLAFGRVMFPQRLDAVPDHAQIVLTLEASENLPADGVAVMFDGGFAPCTEGMTLVAAAASPGRFVARGRYAVSLPDTQ